MGVAIPQPTTPGQDPLIIGAVTFNSEECPSDLPIGGLEQMEAVHNLVGGGVVEHALGPKPKPVSWDGYLFDINVDSRIRQLRAYAAAGQPLLISWRSERYYGVVNSFQPRYQNAYLAKYEIAITITKDANGAFTVSAQPNLDDQVNALSANASSQNSVVGSIDPNGAAAFQPSLSAMQLAINQAGSLAQLSGPSLTSVQNAVTAAISAVGTYVSNVPDTATQFVPANGLLFNLKLIATNIARGQAPYSITQVGGNLYAIASMKYGDISQAFNIMSANSMVSPKIPMATQVTIQLPPLSGNA